MLAQLLEPRAWVRRLAWIALGAVIAAAAALVACGAPVLFGFLLPAGILLKLAVMESEGEWGTRVLGLVECGTHVVTAAEVAPYARSEQAMAAQLLPAKLRPDMLVLADRNFYGFKLWAIACASGARLAA